MESILSTYPICSEYLVNDGGSKDGTLETMKRLKKTYPRIKIFKIPDEKNIRWDSVSNQINTMIHHAKGKIIFLGNADEVIHEEDLKKVEKLASHVLFSDVLRFDRREIKQDWSGLSVDIYHPARLAYKYNGIRQDWNAYGGDEFLYNHGWPDSDRYNRIGITLYHFYNMFPGNYVNKLRNDAEHLAPGDKTRVETYLKMGEGGRQYIPPKKIYSNLPALTKGLPYMAKYEVRECLFNLNWVETVTKLDYS